MCGISGKIYSDPEMPVDPELIGRMRNAIRHRGPDGEGAWLGASAGLGFCRLAIVDPAGGSQPMLNEDRSIALVFNGEIYNFRELRRELEGLGHDFATKSDTEVILHGYEQWGTSVVKYLRGMFAFALYDRRSETLFMARDRLGKKPLYYARLRAGAPDEALIFGSELKALFADPDLPRRMDRTALHYYLAYGYVPEPFCILEGVKKLPPGHWLVFRNGKIEEESYWTLEYEPKLNLSESDAVDATLELLDEAVRLRLEENTPAGCYLSAGIDSAAVVALAGRHSGKRLKTFTAYLEGTAQNELEQARRVARHFDTEHHELVIQPDFSEVLAGIPWKYGEPNGQQSAVSFFYLHRWTAGQVNVMLSGDGGDESFVGYETFRLKRPNRWWNRLPEGMRRSLLEPMRSAATLMGYSSRLTKMYMRCRKSLMRDGSALFADNTIIFPDFQRDWLLPAGAGSRGVRPELLVEDCVFAGYPPEPVDRMMRSNWQMHMPGFTFPKADRLSMAHGMEIRSPFCDHKLVEFAARLPVQLKFKNQEPKWLLKRALRNHLPASVFKVGKIGFGDPDRRSFQKPLRRAAGELLLGPESLSRELFEQKYLKKLIDQHFSGRIDYHDRLWTLLMLETWMRTYLGNHDPLTGPLDLGGLR